MTDEELAEHYRLLKKLGDKLWYVVDRSEYCRDNDKEDNDLERVGPEIFGLEEQNEQGDLVDVPITADILDFVVIARRLGPEFQDKIANLKARCRNLFREVQTLSLENRRFKEVLTLIEGADSKCGPHLLMAAASEGLDGQGQEAVDELKGFQKGGST